MAKRAGARYWVYLLGAGDGWLKVGMTSNPRQRFQYLRSNEFSEVEWFHVGPCGSEMFARTTERLTISALQHTGRRRGRTEIFWGITRATALLLMRAAATEVRGAPTERHAAHAVDTLIRTALPAARSAGERYRADLRRRASDSPATKTFEPSRH